MAFIKFNGVDITFPIFNAGSRSLKNKILNLSTGGVIGLNDQGVVEVKALHNLNFTFNDGDRIGLIGHNGAGKTTLLRVLSGVYHPFVGNIEIQGSISSLVDISMGINPEFSGRENILIRGRLLGLTASEINAHIDEIIDFTKLGSYIDMPLRTYSSGMQLRLAFAVSTIIKPDILIMDEWLSVGDEEFKTDAEKRMQTLVQSSNILIIASHSKEQILHSCNRVLWLEHGNIKIDGSPHEVCQAYFGD
jgi:lipopolysaccharide transport system ATP-binding protein